MNVIDIVRSLLPVGTDGSALIAIGGKKIPASNNVDRCPIWPPDVFAVVGTLIERSGCYTQAGPDHSKPASHRRYLIAVDKVVAEWAGSAASLFETPKRINTLWSRIVGKHSQTNIADVIHQADLVEALLLLFAMSDEACKGMGWDNQIGKSIFSDLALVSFVRNPRISKGVPKLPYVPNSLCALVPPDEVIVMPKTLTATVGCTIRSLSHNLALLPGISQCCPTWALTNEKERDDTYKPVRLLVIPFPYRLSSESFTLAADPHYLVNGNSTAAYFGLEQRWLFTENEKPVTAKMLFGQLVKPLIEQAIAVDVRAVTGVVMPECALSERVADQLALLLCEHQVSFFTTGILALDEASGRTRNLAKTYILDKEKPPIHLEQYKHHRWRLDRTQCEQYGLDFHRLSKANRWWEDIDVSKRKLPFFALRRDMSMTVLICEDLARNDPAMSVVRAIGPNLVIALLMDGPQLSGRWPGRYAGVLGEDPGAGVLSVTCAAMVNRSNASWPTPTRRVIGLWRAEDDCNKEIELPDDSHAVVININSRVALQHTLDNRSDDFGSRKLSLGSVTPLALKKPPFWL